ncbi:uncharacterized protein LOC123542901 [Mercenaria mercenaria]|uniref:uncharacterized protein LOC123542901 n=1 Tax=Mercenaria mercenaria TaxID=6596 RepID=UPI00234E7CCD|nr:uncharacterized protein LOC123542901 [Mercenaria mercenaria]
MQRSIPYKKKDMDRVIGWFWRDSSKTQEKQDELPPTVAAQDTEKTKEPAENLTQVNSNLNKSNSAQVTEVNNQVNNVEPVLYSDVSLNTKMLLWIQKNTYLQPEDCLFCKLTATGCATLLLVGGLNAYSNAATKRNFRTVTVKTSYALIFAMWATFMCKEWCNAVFLPPGDQPRSFLEAEKLNFARYKEKVNFARSKESRKSKEKENKQESGQQ